MDCNVRVVVRFRPVNDKEKAEERTGVLRGSSTSFVIREDQRSVDVMRPDRGGKLDTFTFDRIFSGDATQEEVHEVVAKEATSDVINGYNATLFAYGQTGSGKSYTMFGRDIDSQDRGIIPRVFSEMFRYIADDTEGTEFTIKCSFLEIYKERVRDLLNPKQINLKVHETPGRGVWVEDLTEEFVTSENEIMELLRLGDRFRAVTPTIMNDTSSRSHTLFIVTLHQRLTDGSSKTGRLNLADLAGSEKVAKTGAKGNTLEEAKNINKSLSALGNCINALTTRGKTHVPYRDSKLTHILKESLGGNSKTTLICTCSPHDFNAEETISTLRFGARAKTIKNSVHANKQRSVEELNEIIAVLRKKLKALKRYVAYLESEMRKQNGPDWAPPSVIPKVSSASNKHPPTTPTRSSATPRDSEDLDGELDPVRVAEMQVEMRKLLMASTAQIEQLQDDLRGVQEEEYQNRDKISRLKLELQDKEAEQERLIRDVEAKDRELGAQVAKLHYELKQALLDIESNKAQLDAACKERDERRNEAAELQEEALIAAKERDNILKEIETLLPAEQVEEIRKRITVVSKTQRAKQGEQHSDEEWKKMEQIHAKKTAESAKRIEELELEMEELRQKARQADLALDQEKQRSRQRERDLKRQLELMTEAEEIAKRRAASSTTKVVKPIRLTFREQLFQRKPTVRRQTDGVILKEGWLSKEGGFVRNWKKRWCVLQDGNLYYFEDAKKTVSKGCVLLDECVVSPAESDVKKKHAFAIYHNSRRTFYFQAADSKDMQEWIEAVTKAIEARGEGAADIQSSRHRTLEGSENEN